MIDDALSSFMDDFTTEEYLVRVPVPCGDADASLFHSQTNRLSSIVEIVIIIFTVIFLTWEITPAQADIWKTLVIIIPITTTIIHLVFSIFSHSLRF